MRRRIRGLTASPRTNASAGKRVDFTRGVPSKIGSTRPGHQRTAGVACLCTDCSQGVIKPGADNSVLRLSIGKIEHTKRGTLFSPEYFWFNGDDYIYSHGACAYDNDVNLSDMDMDDCRLQHCTWDLYVPPQHCQPLVYLELGYFNVRSGFVNQMDGVVHWSCARRCWGTAFFEGMKLT